MSITKNQVIEDFLTDRCVTTAELLKEKGYRTYLSGKWHLRGKGNPDCTPTNRGFDEFYGPFRDYASFYKSHLYYRLPEGREKIKLRERTFYATEAISDYAIHFVDDSQKHKKPFLPISGLQCTSFSDSGTEREN